MDIIQRALERKYHISHSEDLNQQTWEQFQTACQGRKVFLFGLGAAGSYLILNYYDQVHFDGVIDNDKSKQGFCIGEFVAEALNTEYANMIISDISLLNQYKPEEVVVLVTSTKFYAPIVKQLEQCGISNYYLLLMMEANKRINIGNAYVKDIESVKMTYLEECCQQEIDKKKIIVSIGNYGGHGKYITEQLLKKGLDLDIVWVVKKFSIDYPDGVRLVYEGNWKKYLYEMETSHIWIYDVALPAYIRKRPEQIYIQTKHWSSITLKKFFLDDSSTTNTKEEIDRIKYNGKIMDYILTGSKFDEETCKSGFAFEGEFVRVGSPRTDALFRPENRKKVYEKYGVNKNINSVLYAPTFRFDKTEKKKHFCFGLDFELLKKALEERFGGEWTIFSDCILLLQMKARK